MMDEHLVPALFGLIGVFVGSFISFGAQLYFLKREERGMKTQRVSSILFKLKMICDDVFTVSQSIRKSLPSKPEGYLWQHVRSLVGVNLRHIEFTPEELACLRTDKRIDVQEFLQLAASRRHAINSTMQAYSDFRKQHDIDSAKLTDINPFNVYQRVQFNSKDHPELVLGVMQLNSMAFEICDMLNEFFIDIAKHQSDLTFVMQKTAKSKNISFKMPDKEININLEGYSKTLGGL